ncbi:MAG: phenylalanine--tRNA ligase subunit alpha [Candidatus Woesearchaeota archaeon]
MEIDKIVSGLSKIELKVLPLLLKSSSFDELVKSSNLMEIEVMRALQWLENKKLVELHSKVSQLVELEENGRLYLDKGLPEQRFLLAVLEKPLTLEEVQHVAHLSKEELNASIGILRQKAAILFKDKKVSLTDNGIHLSSKPTLELKLLKTLVHKPVDVESLEPEERHALSILQVRKGMVKISAKKIWNASLTDLGKKVASSKLSHEHFIEKLTPIIIRNSAWHSKQFRRYDVSINVPSINGGRLHFVSEAVNYIRRIWLDLGFTEMKGSLVQTAFWDLDALFVPQDHPARDMQDTFYIKDPKSGKIPEKLKERVRRVHENGGDTGSLGWRYKWSESLARENLLRTHTTVLSAQAIAALKKSDLPAKFFSVKKVFRNETLSWSHLFELTQVEGIVVDPQANFMHLKGYLNAFFSKMGFEKVRIRPGHFPYTEPSAEVDYWHPLKKKWVELGGSGVFRPEVTKTLMGEEIPVLAWGLGMERSIMEYYQIQDIRDLYKNDIKQLREAKTWMP